MSINIGNTEVLNIYIGDSAATAVYIGDTQIWGAGGKDLPDVPYLCNYNAKDFDETTQTFYRSKNNQLFQEDITGLSGLTLTDDYVSFDGTQGKSYSSTLFNRTSADTTFTAIYKTNYSNTVSDLLKTLFGNRYNSNYNYMLRGDAFHTTNNQFLRFTPSASPQTIVVRVDNQGNAERKCLETGQIATGVVEWGKESNTIGFFCEYYYRNASFFKGDFYWLYMTKEYLTDAQVQQVIDYNNNK